ncbi:hypothetical protein GS501_01060 [Saccharibacter sp. 17.LH.SD]|uniref:hypothetical protein n=1 Tax=Saccharibacter sp. 17.LH.SD TaxID=2689393 RepID=UPI001369AA56|nr:hypothetical protein [Saccharibacter sp. 17.LH.SD]MXV43664.1 hypothetical protein [Saccharibacter sp. 17.LH.SD]
MFALFPSPFICISSQKALTALIDHTTPYEFTIISPPHAGCSFGIPWWQEVIRPYNVTSILDCGASTALALEALERGIDGVVCRDMRSVLPKEWEKRLFPYRPSTLTLGQALR